jgi:hypothetical protein
VAAVSLAGRLGAKICGDEGEIYDLETGQVVRDSETGEVVRVGFANPEND